MPDAGIAHLSRLRYNTYAHFQRRRPKPMFQP